MTEDQNKNKPSLFAFEFVLLLFLGIALFMAAPYLLAIIMGTILAVLTNPIYRYFKKKLNANVSAVITVALVLIVAVGPLTILGISAVKQGVSLGKQIAADKSYSVSAVSERLGKWTPVSTFIDDPTAFEDQVRTALESLGKKLSEGILIQAGNIPDVIIQLVLTLVTCLFLLVDGRTFMTWLQDKIPLDTDIQKAIIQSFQNTSVSVIRAITASAGAQMIVVLIGFLLLRVPAAALGAAATFILSWVPVIGCSPVWMIASLYLYFQGSLTKCFLMFLVGVAAIIVDNVVRPLMLKGKADMHPLVSLLALFGGLHLFGLLGVFLGPIIAAVLILLLQIWPVVAEHAGLVLHPRKKERKN